MTDLLHEDNLSLLDRCQHEEGTLYIWALSCLIAGLSSHRCPAQGGEKKSKTHTNQESIR